MTWDIRLAEIDSRVQLLGRIILFFWVLFFGILGFVLYGYETATIKLTDLGNLLQGTIGVLATVISILYLVQSIRGTEKEIVLASQQSHNQAEEAKTRALAVRVEWERQKLDRALQGRAALLPERPAPHAVGEAASAYAQRLLRQCRSYLTGCNTAEAVVAKSAEIPNSVLTDRYVSHLRLVFTIAAAADEEFGSNQMVDHTWHSLSLEERALVTVLVVCGEPIPKPSKASLASWQIAAEPYLPWNGGQVGAGEFLA